MRVRHCVLVLVLYTFDRCCHCGFFSLQCVFAFENVMLLVSWRTFIYLSASFFFVCFAAVFFAKPEIKILQL